LTSSNTAAQAEIDAVVSQIRPPHPGAGLGHHNHEADPPGYVHRNEQLGLTNGGGANGTLALALLPCSGGAGGAGGFRGGGGGGGGFAFGGGGGVEAAFRVPAEPVARPPGQPQSNQVALRRSMPTASPRPS